MASEDLVKVAAVAQQHGVRLFSNTLGYGFFSSIGGNNDAMQNPDSVWGWLYRNGVSIFQIDRPEASLNYRSSMQK
jgi:glycerophosphoryl diester phosphodiesterase